MDVIGSTIVIISIDNSVNLIDQIYLSRDTSFPEILNPLKERIYVITKQITCKINEVVQIMSFLETQITALVKGMLTNFAPEIGTTGL